MTSSKEVEKKVFALSKAESEVKIIATNYLKMELLNKYEHSISIDDWNVLCNFSGEIRKVKKVYLTENCTSINVLAENSMFKKNVDNNIYPLSYLNCDEISNIAMTVIKVLNWNI